jgi:hypothetical protein
MHIPCTMLARPSTTAPNSQLQFRTEEEGEQHD